MKQISIIGATFYGNRGAEAMLSTTMGTLRERVDEELTFNVFTYYPERDRQLVQDAAVNIYSSTPAYLVAVLFPCALLFRLLGFFRLGFLQRLLPRSVQSLAASQVLICLAGVSFVSGRTKFLPFNIATIWPAMVLGVPVVKYAQAMGPFNERLNRLAARCFLANCHKVFARGEQTHRFMLDFFGPAEFFARADDAAFLFQKEYCLSHEVVDIRSGLDALDSRKQSGQSIVGVCPSIVVAKRAQAAGWNYADRMRQLVEQLVEAGHTVALFPNATRGEDMDKTHNNDLPLLDEIVSGLSDLIREGMVVFGGSLNVAQIHRVIERCDVVAVSRFHAMVGALAARVPVLVIGWSHKYLEVMERFSQADMVLDYQKGEAEPILDRIYMLLHERSVRATQIKAAMPAVQKLAKMQVDFVVNLLEGPQ